VDNIKMALRYRVLGDMDWIDLAQNRDQWRALVNTVMNLRAPWNIGKFLSSCTIGGFSRRAQLLLVKEDIKICEDDNLIRLFCFWTLSIYFLFKTRRFGYLILSPSLDKKPTQLGPISCWRCCQERGTTSTYWV
jgi:hypothetical protein